MGYYYGLNNMSISSHITSSPDIMSGTPVVKGTRIPVKRIIHLFGNGYTADAIHLEYPQLSVDVIMNVINEVAENFDRPMA